MRKFYLGFAFLFLAIGLISAEEFTAKIVKVTNTDDVKEITVSVDGKERVIPIDKTATFKAKGKGTKTKDLDLKAIKEGAEATISTDKRDGKEVVTQILLEGKKKN